jgi:acetolactate decarboxylase
MTNALYLSAPLNALVEGIFKQNVPLSEVKRHGDFGLGTFNELDGEMVLLDGRIYQITGEGKVNEVPDEVQTPFACATFYQATSHDDLAEETEWPAFHEFLLSLFPSPNIMYGLRIEGDFARVKTRSVPRQESYRPLAEAAKGQAVFDLKNVSGTVAGFFTPSFLSSLHVAGLHLHFLSADKTCGGHLLECRPRKVRIGVQFLNRLELSLPLTFDFLTCDLSRDIGEDVRKAER